MDERGHPAPSGGRWLPLLVLVALLALGVAGWFLFPRFAGFMGRQDCIATGRVNC